jgi:Zn-finger nucleic acid-binding protein
MIFCPQCGGRMRLVERFGVQKLLCTKCGAVDVLSDDGRREDDDRSPQ